MIDLVKCEKCKWEGTADTKYPCPNCGAMLKVREKKK